MARFMRLEVTNTPLLKAAVEVSIEHLRPWMPWASHEPIDLDAKIATLRHWRGEFDLDKDTVYGILDREETTALGSTGLHTRPGADAREIGYRMPLCLGKAAPPRRPQR